MDCKLNTSQYLLIKIYIYNVKSSWAFNPKVLVPTLIRCTFQFEFGISILRKAL